jgi:uncharacterized protein (DUF488 family)
MNGESIVSDEKAELTWDMDCNMDENIQFDGKTVFTIGHSNHRLEKFVALLKDNRIEVIVDIRSRPYSRYASQFNKAALEDSIRANGIKYLYLGDVLGGRPDDKRFYDPEGQVVYSRISATPEFHEGVERLIKGANEYRLALTCSEENPLNCHRHHLIARALEGLGITVIHIRGDSRRQSEGDLAQEIETNKKEDKQLSLFQTA